MNKLIFLPLILIFNCSIVFSQSNISDNQNDNSTTQSVVKADNNNETIINSTDTNNNTQIPLQVTDTKPENATLNKAAKINTQYTQPGAEYKYIEMKKEKELKKNRNVQQSEIK